jgi:hypothetical protein
LGIDLGAVGVKIVACDGGGTLLGQVHANSRFRSQLFSKRSLNCRRTCVRARSGLPSPVVVNTCWRISRSAGV